MWDDGARLNQVSVAMTVAAVLAIIAALVAWLARQPVFEFREVVVTKPLARVDAARLEAAMRDGLAGTFFTLDLPAARAAMQDLPWLRSVALRRQWPGRLEVSVDEHQPFARWREGALVNTHGEVFNASWSGVLPQFDGPDEQAALITERYRTWTAVLQPLGLAIEGVRLSARGGWQLRTSGPHGVLTLELGRDEPDARLARFVSAYPRTLAVLARVGTSVEHVDLRYGNGFAARVPSFKERTPAAQRTVKARQ